MERQDEKIEREDKDKTESSRRGETEDSKSQPESTLECCCSPWTVHISLPSASLDPLGLSEGWF